ncbi:hypothetical protein T265_08447 [Opisthorchis viverrini]|uniref:Uncharacterized protein n=1 Tax=Opisthorchis viverrini TaxID=6198 RepID=A0A074Z940_OPIVI|nr:hypothetical protein T265_08447 [Opisthorchis viverrini]KER23721.1 hypothetical protein T265_08447 [Opisthorchis viverrini]
MTFLWRLFALHLEPDPMYFGHLFCEISHWRAYRLTPRTSHGSSAENQACLTVKLAASACPGEAISESGDHEEPPDTKNFVLSACGIPEFYSKTQQLYFLIIIIINDSMTSVLNTNASLPYSHDLFESLIGCTGAGVLPGCPGLNRGSCETEIRLKPRTFLSVNLSSNQLDHLGHGILRN